MAIQWITVARIVGRRGDALHGELQRARAREDAVAAGDVLADIAAHVSNPAIVSFHQWLDSWSTGFDVFSLLSHDADDDGFPIDVAADAFVGDRGILWASAAMPATSVLERITMVDADAAPASSVELARQLRRAIEWPLEGGCVILTRDVFAPSVDDMDSSDAGATADAWTLDRFPRSASLTLDPRPSD